MRIENIVLTIKKRRQGLEESVFTTPPSDYETFRKMQGMWQGLCEALNIIDEEMRKEMNDD